MEIVRGMKVVPHIPLVLLKIAIYTQIYCTRIPLEKRTRTTEDTIA